MTHCTMSEYSYHGATSRSLIEQDKECFFNLVAAVTVERMGHSFAYGARCSS